MINSTNLQTYPIQIQENKKLPTDASLTKQNQQLTKNNTEDKKQKHMHQLKEAVKWGVCIASSVAMFVALTAGINKVTKGGAGSILGRFNTNFENKFGNNKFYKTIDNGIKTLEEKTKNFFNKIPEKYKAAITDKEFGNRRKSMLAADIYQIKTEVSSEFGEKLGESVKNGIKKAVKNKEDFNLEKWLAQHKNNLLKNETANANELNEIANFLKKPSYKENGNLLTDKYLLLEQSDKMSFIPKALTKGLLLFENVSNTSLPLKPNRETLNKLAFPLTFALFGTAPIMKKTIDSDAPKSKKINTFMKDFIVYNAFGIMFFSYAGKIVNSITGLKTLGAARNNLGQVIKKPNGWFEPALDKANKLKFYDYPLKAVGTVLGLGQGTKGSFTPKGLAEGTYGVVCGMGLRFMAAALPIQNVLISPFSKAWDAMFGKPIDFDKIEKEKKESELQKQQQMQFSPNTNSTYTTNITPKEIHPKIPPVFQKFR